MVKIAVPTTLALVSLALSPPAAQAGTFTTLYTFAEAGSYAEPTFVWDGEHTIFGSTSSIIVGSIGSGIGTVFKLDLTSNVVSTLYSFTGGSDGSGSVGPLALLNGTLYGTSSAFPSDVVFSIDPATGKEATLYSFAQAATEIGFTDGLIASGGTLYGASLSGGTALAGTLYSFNPSSSTVKIIHDFGGSPDGREPETPFFIRGSTLFGTTVQGGGTCDCGTVFALNAKTGKETQLTAFASSNTITAGATGLLEEHGVLYGSTVGNYVTLATGSAKHLDSMTPGEFGTIYALDPATHAYKLLYSFSGGADGAYPAGSLVIRGGVIYGTTLAGGDLKSSCGVVFAIDSRTGIETVLHALDRSVDGCAPLGLTYANGAFYGATYGQPLVTGGPAATLFRFTR